MFSVLAAGAFVVPLGSAAFFYGPESISGTHPAYFEYDPVRENHIFHDQYDMVYGGQKFYNVYFAAQSTGAVNGSEIQTAAQSTFSPSSPTYEDYEDPKFGQFSDGSYYKVFENVTSISTSQLDGVTGANAPYCAIYDRGAAEASSPWYSALSFIGWSLDPVPNYAIWKRASDGGEDDTILPWPKMSDLNTVTREDGTQHFVVAGYYPYHDSFRSFYSNTTLSTYDSYAKDFDGDGVSNDLVLYPIYTTGKNYFYSQRDTGNANLRDSLTVQVGSKSYTPVYDGYLSNGLSLSKGENNHNSDMMDTWVYRLDNFEADGDCSISLDIDFSKGSWNNHIHEVDAFRYGAGGVAVQGNDGIFENVSGRFNMYIVVLAVDHASGYQTDQYLIKDSDWQEIKSDLENMSVSTYFIDVSPVTWSKSSWQIGDMLWERYNDYRSVAIVLERLYEPRLIGGPTKALEYDSKGSRDMPFVRIGEGADKNTYRLMDVDLSGNVQNALTSGDHTVTADSTWFAIQTVSQDSLAYNMEVPEDPVDESALPSIIVNGETERFYGARHLERYEESKDYGPNQPLVNGSSKPTQAGFPMVHVKSPGTYDIEIKLSFSGLNSTTDVSTLQGVAIRVHYRVVHFINIVLATEDEILNDPSRYREETGLKMYLKTNIYDYRCDQYSEGETLSGGNAFRDVSGQVSTFQQILQEQEAQGYWLMDIVTGRIFTSSNVVESPFLVERSCILMRTPITEQGGRA